MFKISNEERKVLLDYMSKRPYAEVYTMVAMIVALKPIEEKKEDKPKKVVMWWKIKSVLNAKVMVFCNAQ